MGFGPGGLDCNEVLADVSEDTGSVGQAFC